MTDHLFVYGTLMRGRGNLMHDAYLARHAVFLGEGHFHGRLYELPDYPGAVLSDDAGDKVYGELYALADGRKAFEILDAYEGRDFVRQIVPIRRADGTEHPAWVYLFIRPVAGLPRIDSGRFTGMEI